MKQPLPAPLAHLHAKLGELERAGLRRYPPAAVVAEASTSFCSNDYLGLAARLAPSAAGGSGASRLIAGEREEHRRLERALSTWLGLEDALAFTSGYAANVGTVSALAGPGDLIVSDVLNHASIIDGARLSRARVAIVPHGDVGAIRGALAARSEARAWVLVESYYSMDADGPDLGRLREVCDEHGAGLFVDEAHALGVLGPNGRGRCAEAGISPDVLVGTLGKSFGTQGAFAAGSVVVRDWLWNRARSFVFSTGLAPVCAAAALASLQTFERSPELCERVLSSAKALREGLVGAGAIDDSNDASSDHGAANRDSPRLLGFGHVLPVVLGTPARALRWAEHMRARGVEVQAIRPPTIPDGLARLRLTVTAAHGAEDIARAIDAFASAGAGEAAMGRSRARAGE